MRTLLVTLCIQRGYIMIIKTPAGRQLTSLEMNLTEDKEMSRKLIQLDTVSLGIFFFTFVIVYLTLFLVNYHMQTDTVSMYQSVLAQEICTL